MARRGPHNPAITWTPHLKVSWGGTLGTGTKEVWTNSIRFLYLAAGFVPSEAQLTVADAGVWAALQNWFGDTSAGSSSFIGEDAHLAWLKMNSIDVNGLQVSQATHQYDPAPQAGLNLNTVPFYQTYAITLRTALKRGRAHSGRIFPPLVEPVVEVGTGMCTTQSATAMANSFATCLKAMTTALVTASQVGSFAVLSPGNTTKGQLPLATVITSTVVDRVPDVQHRRTNRLPRAEGNVIVAV